MQEALGADFTDFNRPAQLSSADLNTDHRLHSFPGSSFPPLTQATARRASALNGIFLGRRLRASISRGLLYRTAKLRRREFGIDLAPEGELDRSPAKGAMSDLVPHGFAARPLSPCGRRPMRFKRLPKYDNWLLVRLSFAVSKRSDRRINVRNSSLSIASERWIIRASPDGLQ